MNQDDKSSMSTPQIISPVASVFYVSDLESSLVFYCDVLQFEKPEDGQELGRSGVEIVRGPARIRLHLDRQANPTILFFETNDLSAIHAAIAARGGMPSQILRVNWIKVNMFEVRDPDGNTLWFGQSFAQSAGNEHSSASGMLQAVPQFLLNNLPAGIEHYRDLFGFKVKFKNNGMGFMQRDKVTLVLAAKTTLYDAVSSAYVYTSNVDELHAELSAKGANILGNPISRWGLRNFDVLDLEGNRIRFSQRLE